MKLKNIITNSTTILIILFIGFLSGRISAENFKIIDIPGNIKTEENVARVSIVNNLSKTGEIYRAGDIIIIGDAIYATFSKTCEVIKFNLNGKIESRVGRAGAGPAEFKWICKPRSYKEYVAVLDQSLMKIVLFNTNLELIKELRIKDNYKDFFVDKFNQFVFVGPSSRDYYFEICSENCKPIKKFGKCRYYEEEKLNKKIHHGDFVINLLYLPDQNGILCSYYGMYNLWYYRNEKKTLEIRAEKDFFSGKFENIMGIKAYTTKDYPIYLSKFQNCLYYFYNRSQKTFCDIFDINNFQLIRRLMIFPRCVRIAQYKENIFYGFGYDSNQEDDLILVKIII